MTDYNELIERLRSNHDCSMACDALEAATAIETLVTELAEERHRHDRLQDFEVAQAQELARVKAERDAAVEDLRKHCSCGVCSYGKCYIRGGTEQCNFQYRGPKKEEQV